MFSNDTIYAGVSDYGIGTFANRDIKPNEHVMEIPANYTISSFDSFFPYMDIADKVAKQFENDTSIDQINIFKLILNFNYLRYVDRSNRFFRIYFDNLPNYMEYFPFWPEDEKHIVRKFMADPSMNSDLLLHNNTVLDYMFEDIKRVIRRKDPNLVASILSDKRIEEAINLVNSRSYLFSLKGWKAMNNLQEKIEPEDINNIGYVIIPGADGINHDSIRDEHIDASRSNLSFQKGFVAIKSHRKFKKGDEFTINYDRFIGIQEIFKKYGFVPLDSINHNQVYENEYYHFKNSTFEFKQLCLALGACYGGTPDQNTFKIARWTNGMNKGHLNLNRLNYWTGLPMNEYKVIDIFNQIKNDRHSNITEGLSLSKFAHEMYGTVIYAANFRMGIDNLLKMYEMNEAHTDLREIFAITNVKLTVTEHPTTIHQRFRELIKFALLNQHMTAVNLKETQIMMRRNIDNLWIECKQEILENIE